jgi:hypothetical protein
MVFVSMCKSDRHVCLRALACIVGRPVLADLATIQTVLAATIPTRTDSGWNRTTEASSKVPYRLRMTSST